MICSFVSNLKDSLSLTSIYPLSTLEEKAFTFDGEKIKNPYTQIKMQMNAIETFYARDLIEGLDNNLIDIYDNILKDLRRSCANVNDGNIEELKEKIVYFQLLTGMEVSFYTALTKVSSKFMIAVSTLTDKKTKSELHNYTDENPMPSKSKNKNKNSISLGKTTWIQPVDKFEKEEISSTYQNDSIELDNETCANLYFTTFNKNRNR